MLFLDSADATECRELFGRYALRGVTTNPSIMAKDGAENAAARVRQILEVTTGSVSMQVTSTTADGMAEEASRIVAIDPRMVVKLPMCEAAFDVKWTFPVNVTAVMTVRQALLALDRGATYVSLFWNRILDGSEFPDAIAIRVRQIIERYNYSSRIIVGSIRKPDDVGDAIWSGAHIVTVPPKVLRAMHQHPQTDRAMADFAAAASKCSST